ncbi:hypothetical protein VMCG_09411 [Cytospora schulzeri]|uniref:BTB domain-containing protein n=1 Tax=Cytospora schulzeri TaxID=448051 RepID=A0A423VIJ4_9PEZI|nr:hypothetical protein VMCG_09411 [Valsa malicola]
MSNYQSFYNNPSLSDVTLVFSGRRLPVHKVILAAKNKYFRAFAEATATEVELHDDNPDALERLIKCLYGFDVDILSEHYAKPLVRADPMEVPPRGGWSDDAAKNCLASQPRRRDDVTRAWELSPRCRDAFAETIDLYIVADKYLADEVCAAQIKRFDFTMLNWFFYNTYFSTNSVDVGEIAEIFGPLYDQTGGPEDAMRRRLAGFFDGWWVTSVGPVPDQLRTLYEALPDLHSDILHLQASRAAAGKNGGAHLDPFSQLYTTAGL